MKRWRCRRSWGGIWMGALYRSGSVGVRWTMTIIFCNGRKGKSVPYTRLRKIWPTDSLLACPPSFLPSFLPSFPPFFFRVIVIIRHSTKKVLCVQLCFTYLVNTSATRAQYSIAAMTWRRQRFLTVRWWD